MIEFWHGRPKFIHLGFESRKTKRRIAKTVRKKAPHLWLAGGDKPDLRTIDNLCPCHLKQGIREAVSETVDILVEDGYIGLDIRRRDKGRIPL